MPGDGHALAGLRGEDHHGLRAAQTRLLAGLGFVFVGLLLFARAPVDANYMVDVFPVMVLLGFGAGVSFPALMTLAMSGATPQDSGLASGLVNTTIQVAARSGSPCWRRSRASAPRG